MAEHNKVQEKSVRKTPDGDQSPRDGQDPHHRSARHCLGDRTETHGYQEKISELREETQAQFAKFQEQITALQKQSAGMQEQIRAQTRLLYWIAGVGVLVVTPLLSTPFIGG